MKVKFLGTAAAEGVPALFCQCDVCKRSRAAGGRNIRTRLQTLVDDSLLIDFPPDTYWHVITNDIDLSQIEHCLVTHSHSDHLYPDDVSFRRNGYAHLTEAPRYLNFHASMPTLEHLKSSPMSDLNADEDSSGARIYRHYAFESFWAGEFLVTALPANHSTEEPFIYIVKRRGKSLFYAHDTGPLKDETWEWLEENTPHFDIVSLDCTSAVKHENSGRHMTFEQCVAVRNRLKKLGCIDEKTVMCLNHFSHNGRVTYDEFAPLAEKEGFVAAYDGMTVEI